MNVWIGSLVTALVGVLGFIVAWKNHKEKIELAIKQEKDRRLKEYRDKYNEIYQRHIEFFNSISINVNENAANLIGEVYKMQLLSNKIKNEDLNTLQTILKDYKRDELDTNNQICKNLETMIEILEFIHSHTNKSDVDYAKYIECINKISSLKEN